ncbi:hypothetical protein BGW39_009214 [Mortierella sp. 14UC]|nr:hypothetical protein BGW39_009214 [Mortierella sp. 14UC]
MFLHRSLSFKLLCSFLAAVSVSATSAADTNADINLLSKAGTFSSYTIAHPGPGGPRPRPIQCSNPGFFCKSTVVFADPGTSPNPNYRGGGALGGNVQADQFICPSSDAYAVRIASCPQGDCEQNYCVGGGPAKVPERLPSGSGLYCGKTLNAQYTGGVGQSQEAHGGGLGGGFGGGGGGRPPRGEYVRNNLYYFIGSYGVNLGPCPYQCVNAGAGTPDYCATSAY